MATAMLKSAISCVRSLQKGQIRDDSLFNDPQNTALASAMSLLSNTANYIETAVNTCTHLFDIEILVLCRVKANGQSHARKHKHFVLWNTLVPSERAIVSPNRSSDEEGHVPAASNETTGIRHERYNAECSQIPIFSNRNAPRPATGHPISTTEVPVVTARPCQAEKNPFSSGEYSVPVNIATECLHLLLDASGFSSHRNCFQQSSYTNLGSKVLVEALRKVLDAESKRRVQDEEDHCLLPEASPTKPRTQQLNSRTDLIYMDLLPDHLRSSQEKETFALLPVVKFSGRESPSVIRRVKVSLNIRKPDRNKKNQNFAVLCILLHHTGRDGTCAGVLRKYAKEGLSSEGCTRRKKFYAGPNSDCGGFKSCSSVNRTLCTFFNDKRSRIGMGTVYPLIRELNGKSLEEGEIVIRVGTVDKNVQTEHGHAEDGTIGNSNVPSNRLVIWNKSLVSRVVLHSDYGAKVATAILVEDAMPKEVRESLLKSSNKKFQRQANLDITRAVVVCDLQPIPGAQTFRYPYAEWYSLSSLVSLKTAHFGQNEVPDMFSDVNFRSIFSILWHQDKFVPIQAR